MKRTEKEEERRYDKRKEFHRRKEGDEKRKDERTRKWKSERGIIYENAKEERAKGNAKKERTMTDISPSTKSLLHPTILANPPDSARLTASILPPTPPPLLSSDSIPSLQGYQRMPVDRERIRHRSYQCFLPREREGWHHLLLGSSRHNGRIPGFP